VAAIGLPVALSIGMENFNKLRGGAELMDRHFAETPLEQNLPVLLGMLGIWYINYWHTASHAVLPYLHRLRCFPEFLQQLEMESNGKSMRLDHVPAAYPTAGVIWGTVETNGQHSFHQLLHQGTQLIPVDFILSLRPEIDHDPHHAHLVANSLAQANALMTGRTLEEATQEFSAGGHSPEKAAKLALHRVMPGNRPSTMIVMDKLTPETLGALIALYEHKVYVQSVVWNINAFDQWGVELGKVVSNRIYGRLTGGTGPVFDSSTEGLIDLYGGSK
jgi:glucose-6-phosphate isomerase